MKLETTSTIQVYQGKYYRCNIPKELGEQILGLAIDRKKQKIRWKIRAGKVVVEKAGN